MDFPNDNVTCIGPWYELRINHDGSYSYCHSALVKDVSPLTPSQWFKTGAMSTQARSCIKSGEQVAGCKNCYRAESLGLASHRNKRNFQAAVFDGEFFKHSLSQSPVFKRLSGDSTDIKPAFIHVSLDNLCNLACRMCKPHNSSKLVSVFKRAELIDVNTPVHLSWTDDKQKWDSFVELVLDNPDLISLHFMGGEPLLHEKFYQLIEHCVAENKTNFHLTFVSNGTIFNSEIVEKLKKFKSVQIEISIENLHETNNYIRIGSDIQQIKDNINKFLQHRSEDFTVVLRTVPQALSIEHYDTLIDFAIENQLTVDSNVLHEPEHFKINVLPAGIKQNLINYISTKYSDILDNTFSNVETISYFRNNTEFLKSMSAHIQSIITLLKEKEPENIEVLRAQFLEFNQRLDKVSGYNFSNLYPDIIF